VIFIRREKNKTKGTQAPLKDKKKTLQPGMEAIPKQDRKPQTTPNQKKTV
jgi:hypothetical protein